MKIILIFLALFFNISTYAKDISSDSDIKKLIIQESINQYPGNCPCPYNSAKNGSNCGKRSAYLRGGGYSPLCFESDVTPKMVKIYRSDH
jgi:hypothetical protein